MMFFLIAKDHLQLLNMYHDQLNFIYQITKNTMLLKLSSVTLFCKIIENKDTFLILLIVFTLVRLSKNHFFHSIRQDYFYAFPNSKKIIQNDSLLGISISKKVLMSKLVASNITYIYI